MWLKDWFVGAGGGGGCKKTLNTYIDNIHRAKESIHFLVDLVVYLVYCNHFERAASACCITVNRFFLS